MILATALAAAVIATASMAATPKTPWVSLDSDDVVAESLAKAIYSQAKDPTSVRFLSLGTPDGEAWCVVYSATNSFNARITEQMYFNNRTTHASKAAGAFNRHCAGTLRKDWHPAATPSQTGSFRASRDPAATSRGSRFLSDRRSRASAWNS